MSMIFHNELKKGNAKIAIVHDWLISLGGAEKVLQEIYHCFPSPIFTLFSKHHLYPDIRTSYLQYLPLRYYRYYFPFFPGAIESFDLSEFDIILSSSHCAAKGVKKHPGQLHICYCHTPFRYANLFTPFRKWDREASKRVDHFIANSQFIADRIMQRYQREASVIYPPVETSYYALQKKEDYYVVISRLVAHKKVDLIVRAFQKMPKKRLLVIGEGPQMKKIQRLATANVEVLGYVKEVKGILERARGFIHAAEEDFGIAVVEAQAAGTPVLAYGVGGARETVIENQTGMFFAKQNEESLIRTLQYFESKTWEYDKIQIHAKSFDAKIFRERFQSLCRSLF